MVVCLRLRLFLFVPLAVLVFSAGAQEVESASPSEPGCAQDGRVSRPRRQRTSQSRHPPASGSGLGENLWTG